MLFPALFAVTLMFAFATRPAVADTEGHFDRTLTVADRWTWTLRPAPATSSFAGGLVTVEIHREIRPAGTSLATSSSACTISKRIRRLSRTATRYASSR